MTVIFLLAGDISRPSTRYRVLQYLPYLKEHGVIPTCVEISKAPEGKRRLFKSLSNYDVVFLQRKRLGFWDTTQLRKNAKRLIYDFDDAIMFRDVRAKNPFSRSRARKFARIASCSDLIIAGNQFLKEYALKYNDNVEVIPTCVDVVRYRLKETRRDCQQVTLGWIGSKPNLVYLEGLRRVFEILGQRFPNLRLKIVADGFIESLGLPVVKKKWRLEDEVEDVCSFDIGLMPLSDNPWSRGKCGLKLLQYMAAGLPTVASPYGVNPEVVVHNKTGFLAESHQDWVKYLSILIEDKDLRASLGHYGTERVERCYSLKATAPKLFALFQRLCEGIT